MERELWEICYKAPTDWQGRQDSKPGERLFQVVKPIDLKQSDLKKLPGAIAFIGFASDEGVKRNLGRVGAGEGPQAIRAQLANLTINKTLPMLVDLGDITCRLGDLESAQKGLGEIVTKCLQQGYFPIVLGGGHDVAYGHYQGLQAHTHHTQLGIINMDAHFDLRPCEEGRGSSGTAFLQIAELRKQASQPFSYLCLGIEPTSNTKSLYQTADSLNVDYCEAHLIHEDIDNVLSGLSTFLDEHPGIYLSICMDVFAQAYAPGVSAPSALGLTPWQGLTLIEKIMKSGKVIALDIAECAPALDHDNMTAKLAARLIYNILNKMSK